LKTAAASSQPSTAVLLSIKTFGKPKSCSSALSHNLSFGFRVIFFGKRKNDDWKFQSFRFMNRHNPNCIGAFRDGILNFSAFLSQKFKKSDIPA
jgi:hypothetical protein